MPTLPPESSHDRPAWATPSFAVSLLIALAALAIAHAAIDLQVAPRLAVPPRVRPTIDGIQLMPDGGLTAADQRQDLAPLVDRPVTRTEG